MNPNPDRFEARDRAKNPHAWAVHDHMMARCRSEPKKPLLTPGRVLLALVIIVVLIANMT